MEKLDSVMNESSYLRCALSSCPQTLGTMRLEATDGTELRCDPTTLTMRSDAV